MRFVAVGLLAALLSGSAFAADMPVKARPVAPVAYSWTGCYLGGYIGGATDDSGSRFSDEYFTTSVIPIPPGTFFFTTNGNNAAHYSSSGIAGGTLGCNYQVTNWLFGLEGEVGYLHMSSSDQNVNAARFNDIDINSSTVGNWYAVAAARVGWVNDRVLFYLKGGAAWTSVSAADAGVIVPAFSQWSFASGVNNAVGFAAGGGIEWAFLGNWSIKGEALYLGFNKSYTACGPGLNQAFAMTGCVNERLGGVMTAKIGLNYRFDWAAGPVVARY